jgi:uroporphyrinogen-III decarboxylase
VVGCIHSAAFNVEAFGGKMKCPEYGIPSVLVHPFENIIDIPDVSPEPSGKALGALRSYSLVRKSMPDVAVVANVEGPLTKAGTITGMETLSIYLETEKDLMNDIISLCTDHTQAFLEHLDKDGSIDCVFLASATDNPDLFGCNIYTEFSMRWVSDIVKKVHRYGYPVIFHPHGVFTSPGAETIFDETVRTGIDGFQFAEDNDPGKIVSMTGNRCSILGGTDVVPTLLNGPDRRIMDDTLGYIDACKDSNHVFMCSCSLHRATPLDNVKVMADTIHRYNGRSI